MQLHYHSNGCLTIDIKRSSERSAIDRILNTHKLEVRDFRMYLVACPNNGSENNSTTAIFRPTTRHISNGELQISSAGDRKPEKFKTSKAPLVDISERIKAPTYYLRVSI